MMIRLIILVLLVPCFCYAQAGTEIKYEPWWKSSGYVSISTSFSSGAPTYALEGGIYNTRWWAALTVEASDIGDSQYSMWVGPKIYRKIGNISFGDNNSSDLYFYGAAKIHISSKRDLCFEPGLAYVFNMGKKLAVQVTASTPIYEGFQVSMSSGIGLNYWF